MPSPMPRWLVGMSCAFRPPTPAHTSQHPPPSGSAAPTQSKRSRVFRCTRAGRQPANAEGAAARALPYHAGTAPSPRSTLARRIRAEAPRRAHCVDGNRGRSILLRTDTALRTAPNKYLGSTRWRKRHSHAVMPCCGCQGADTATRSKRRSYIIERPRKGQGAKTENR